MHLLAYQCDLVCYLTVYQQPVELMQNVSSVIVHHTIVAHHTSQVVVCAL